MKFQRVKPKKATHDEVGKVRISIHLCTEHPKSKGNSTGNITLADAKVTDVTRAIELALFGEEDD